MFRFIKRAFIALLSFNGSLPTKCILLNNQLCMKRPFLFYINPDELIQGLRHYPLIVSLDKCDKIYVPNKTEDVDVKVFNVPAEINEAKAFIKNISCLCKCKFDNKKCKENDKWHGNKCWYECKKWMEYRVSKVDYT